MNSNKEIQELVDRLNQNHPQWSDAWHELKSVLEDELDDKRRKRGSKQEIHFLLFIVFGILLSISSLVGLAYLIAYFISL